jgi:murein L,D-transpeptidase YcbB/YkuD
VSGFETTNYASLLTRVHDRSQNKITEARRVFKDASQRKGLDWAEAIWERWVLFEYEFGTLEEVTKTLSVVKEFKRVEDARRKKAWEAHAQAQAAAYAANGTAANSTIQSSAAPAVVTTDTSMDVDVQPKDVGERSLKRKRSVEEVVESSPTAKKSKYGESTASFPAVNAVPAACEFFSCSEVA